MRRIGFLLAGIFLCGFAGSARAGFVIYSNFGPAQSYNASSYYSISGGGLGDQGPPTGYGFALAESFTPTVNVLFGSVELPLAVVIPGSTNSFTVSLMSDVGVHPGVQLESFSITDVPLYPNPTIEQFTSTIHTPLYAGTTYWIAVIPNAASTAGGWFMNSTGATGIDKTGNDGVTWSNFPVESAAFEVDGVQAVPEPSSLSLAAIAGLCGLAFLRLSPFVVAKGRAWLRVNGILS